MWKPEETALWSWLSFHPYRGWEEGKLRSPDVQALLPLNCLAHYLDIFNQKRKFCWVVSQKPDVGTREMPVIESTGWLFQRSQVQFLAITFIYNGIQFPFLACRSTCRQSTHIHKINKQTNKTTLVATGTRDF